MALGLKWIPRLIRWRNPFQKGAQEASDQYLGKKAKSQTLYDLVMTRDIQELAEADREKVNLLFKKHNMDLGGNKSKGDRDTWACDDMTINAGGSNGPLWLVLGLLVGAGAFWYMNKDKEPPPPTPTTPTINVPDSEYEVRFFDKDGNQITVPRLPFQPAEAATDVSTQ